MVKHVTSPDSYAYYAGSWYYSLGPGLVPHMSADSYWEVGHDSDWYWHNHLFRNYCYTDLAGGDSYYSDRRRVLPAGQNFAFHHAGREDGRSQYEQTGQTHVSDDCACSSPLALPAALGAWTEASVAAKRRVRYDLIWTQYLGLQLTW